MKISLQFSLAASLILSSNFACKKIQEPETAVHTNEKVIVNAPTTININADNTGNTVDSLMFGGVFEGHRLNLSQTSIQSAIELLHPTLLRNPGGTYAVCGYHYRLSEDGQGGPIDSVSSFNTDKEVATRHTTFLDFCQSHNIVPQLIIPSDRYSDVSPGLGLSAGRAYAKNFVTDINITPDANHPDLGHHGHQKVKYWNLGNEDYPANINFNYANMAKNYANDLVALDNYVKPTVNWKWNKPADAQALSNTLGFATYRGVFTNVLEPSDNYSEKAILDSIKKGRNYFPAGKQDLQIGAWQVASNIAWPWMQSASIFNRRFATFVQAGATMACYWPMINSNEEEQARLVNGGSAPTLAPCGQLFKWLYQSANGKKILEGITVANNGVEVTAYRNFSSTKIVVFVCGNNASTNTQVEINLSNFALNSATGDVLSEGTQVGSGNQASSQPIITSGIPLTVNSSAKKITFKINQKSKFEIARIVIN